LQALLNSAGLPGYSFQFNPIIHCIIYGPMKSPERSCMLSPTSGTSFFLLPLLGLLLACSPQIAENTSSEERAPAAESLQQPLDPAFTEYLRQRMNIEQVPGISIAMVEDGQPPAFYNFGQVAPDSASEAVSAQTLYEIGSVTKTFTASLYAILMQHPDYAHAFPDGADTPVNELLAYINADSQLRLPEFGGDAITFKHLLTHHSGLPRLPQNMTPAADDDPYRDFTRAQLVESVITLELTQAPGSQFAYSNLGFMVLGHVAELLTDQDYDALIASYITEPLEMQSTARLSEFFTLENAATPTMNGEVVSRWRFEQLRGLGELYSNARDMARYLEAQLDQNEYAYADALQQTHAQAAEIEEDFNFGLGWFREASAGHTLISHGGGTGGFRSYLAFHPESGRGVVVLSNSGSDVSDIARHLLHPEAELRPLPDTSPQDEELLSKITGLYISDMLPMLTVSQQEGVLTAQLEGQPSFAMEPVESDEGAIIFQNRSIAVQLEFLFGDSATRANGAELRQAGQRFQFTYTEEAPDGPQEISLSPEEMMVYEGTYDAAVGMSYEIFLDGERLMARLTGQPAAQIFPEGNDRFFYKMVPAALEFKRDADGSIESVELQQGGQQILFLLDNEK
jgi:CubicO group peptidase (beta-lactamase class C family)